MNEPFPITPPPELVEQWYDEIPGSSTDWKQQLATQAAQWGADQELEACSRWIEDQLCMPPDARADVITKLNDTRRPKPPSLKEQALADLYDIYTSQPFPVGDNRFNCIRRALETLDD